LFSAFTVLLEWFYLFSSLATRFFKHGSWFTFLSFETERVIIVFKGALAGVSASEVTVSIIVGSTFPDLAF